MMGGGWCTSCGLVVVVELGTCFVNVCVTASKYVMDSHWTKPLLYIERRSPTIVLIFFYDGFYSETAFYHSQGPRAHIGLRFGRMGKENNQMIAEQSVGRGKDAHIAGSLKHLYANCAIQACTCRSFCFQGLKHTACH